MRRWLRQMGRVGLAALGLSLPALAQTEGTEPCPTVQARRNRPALGLTLDSLRLAALRPADACQAWAEGTYRGRRLLALAGRGGQLQDTLALRSDSARVLWVPAGGGVLALRAGLLEGSIVYHRYLADPALGLTAEPQAELLLTGIEGIDILPRGPEDPQGISFEESKQYAKVTFWLRAAGSHGGKLALLLERREALCKPGAPDNGLYDYGWQLVLLPLDGLGRPQRTGAQALPLPDNYNTARASGTVPKALPEETRPLHPHQPVVPDGSGGWLLADGQALRQLTAQGWQKVALPKGTQPSQVWAEGQVGATPPQLYLRTGGVLRQADEGRAFRLREVWVSTGVIALPVAELRPELVLRKMPRLPLPDEAVAGGIPLAYWQGRWWLAGRQPALQPQAKPAFGR